MEDNWYLKVSCVGYSQIYPQTKELRSHEMNRFDDVYDDEDASKRTISECSKK